MKVIGIDVDGTLAEYSGFGKPIGELKLGAFRFLVHLKLDDWTICLWSCRPAYEIQDWIEEKRIIKYISHINESPLPSDSIKPNFHVYLGDEAVAFTGEYEIPKSDFYWGTENNERDVDRSSENLIPYLKGTGTVFLEHFEKLFKALWRKKQKFKTVAFLTICSHAKPYSKSYIHGSIRERLHNLGVLDSVDYLHISNAGIIPHEDSLTPPFDAYDWDNSKASERVRKLLRDTIVRRLKWWLENYGERYDKLVIYLRYNGTTLSAVREVLESASNDIPYQIVPALESDIGLPWLLHKDPDDCLTLFTNLHTLKLNHFKRSNL